jgi:Tfp pilus assembly protein PilP
MLLDCFLVSPINLQVIEERIMIHNTLHSVRASHSAGVLILILMVLAGLAAGNLFAQEPQQEQPMDDSGITADIPRAPTPVPAEEQQTRYTGQNTRDPFVSLLLQRESDVTKTGLAAMKISEISVQGIQIGLGTVAIVLGTDGKAYNMRVGDLLLDGKVVAIDSNRVVFEKVVLDSFGRETDKEVIEYHLHR